MSTNHCLYVHNSSRPSFLWDIFFMHINSLNFFKLNKMPRENKLFIYIKNILIKLKVFNYTICVKLPTQVSINKKKIKTQSIWGGKTKNKKNKTRKHHLSKLHKFILIQRFYFIFLFLFRHERYRPLQDQNWSPPLATVCHQKASLTSEYVFFASTIWLFSILYLRFATAKTGERFWSRASNFEAVFTSSRFLNLSWFVVSYNWGWFGMSFRNQD